MSIPISIFLIVAIGWLWLDGARARELATGICAESCRKLRLQFLDETVSLARIGIRRTPYGLRIRRMFRFDYSLEGTGRRIGHIILVGTQLEALDMDLPEPERPGTSVNSPSPHHEEKKVIPFPKQRD